MAKAQPRKNLKMPALPPLPTSDTPPALPPRRAAPPPPQIDQDDYDEFTVDSDDHTENGSDAEENYDQFEGVEPTSGPSVYEITDDSGAPPPPPLPSSNRPKPLHTPVEEEYMDPDDESFRASAGSTNSTDSSRSDDAPPVPSIQSRKKIDVPTKEKKKSSFPSVPSIDTNILAAVKNKLKKVPDTNKSPKSEISSESDKSIFGKPLKPVIPNKPDTNGIDTPKQKPRITPRERIGESVADDGEIYDDAESLPQDPFMKYDWYHGEISREESTTKLKRLNMDGAYLVRKSKNSARPDHLYTLAVLYEGKISNLKIRTRSDGKYALGELKDNEVTFDDMPKIITHHQKNDVILIGTKQGQVKLIKTPSKY